MRTKLVEGDLDANLDANLDADLDIEEVVVGTKRGHTAPTTVSD